MRVSQNDRKGKNAEQMLHDANDAKPSVQRKEHFSSRIVCGDCGSYFGSKVWNSTSKYRRVIWQCNSKFKGERKCETPHLDEETIKAGFVVALNAIIDSKDSILEDCRLMQTTLTDCTGIDAEIESLLEEIDVVTELAKRCIA